jgi:hypothetical protein
MYRILSISNERSNAAPFTFEREQVSTITSSDIIQDGPFPGTQNELLGDQSIYTYGVPAGHTEAPGGGLGCFIVYAQADDPSELNNMSALIDLVYAQDLDQPVSILRSGSDTSTAVAVGGPVSAATLQQYCGTGGTP